MSPRPPLYRIVADQIRSRIQEGGVGRGSRLPGEDDLARDLEVGRSTIREALRALEEEGLIIRRHGIGSFVSHNFDRMRGNLETLESFAESIRRSGYEAKVETIGVDIQPISDRAADALEVPRGTEVCYIRLMYFGNGRPAILSRTSLPKHLVNPERWASRRWPNSSVREYLVNEKRLDIRCAYLSVSAALAGADLSEHFGISSTAPLMVLEGPAYDQEGAPVYHTEAFFNTDVYSFSVVRR